MRKVFYLFVAIVFVPLFMACSKQDDKMNEFEQNIETRATSLGFANADAYKASVAEQCDLGNHENCEILSDGTHQACGAVGHSGKRHNGEQHRGSGHNGNCSNSNNGNRNNGNGGNGGHCR